MQIRWAPAPQALNRDALDVTTVLRLRPLYDARVRDLGPDDLVLVECLRCDHSERLTALMLKTAGLPPHAVIKDLDRRMRCRECDARGRVSISIRWTDA